MRQNGGGKREEKGEKYKRVRINIKKMGKDKNKKGRPDPPSAIKLKRKTP